MKLTVNNHKNLILFTIPLFAIGLLVFLTTTSVFSKNTNSFSNAITIDLLVTIPLLYFFLIRKTKVPKTTIVPFIIIGMIICSFIIPVENQHYLSLFKTWIFPLIELFVVSYVIYSIRKTIKKYKEQKTTSLDFFTTLKNTCNEILPKAAVAPIVTEIAIFYYGFILWKNTPLKENQFTYHKNSGSISLLAGLLFIVAVEMVTIHSLIAKWNVTVAWILTFLSIYSSFQIFGFIKSMTKRPTAIQDHKILLRYGIMAETEIDIHNIESITVSSKEIEFNKEVRQLSPLGTLEAHNIIINLKDEATLSGLYGIKKKFKTLAIHMDKKNEFVTAVNKILLSH